MKRKRIALLDTDFISKSFTSCAAADHLIDRVLEFPGLDFCCCHHQITIELSHYTGEVSQWLDKMIQDKRVSCYTDEKILDELEKVYGSYGHHFYIQFLREACAAYGKDYFATYYADLSSQQRTDMSREEFLEALSNGDASIGTKQDLGELKTAVLLQVLSNLNDAEMHVFCSDDKNARAGMTQFPNVSCMSILTAFWELKELMTKEELRLYYDSFVESLHPTQKGFKVIEANGTGRLLTITFEQFFEDLILGKMDALGTGMLRYKS